MVSIQVYTAARMAAIEAKAIVNAAYDAATGLLTLTKYDGTVYGPFNVKGATGATGAPGAAGAKWWDVVGTGAPASGTGVVGDWAINDNGDYYEKTGTSTWTNRGNLKGPAGAAGLTLQTATSACTAAGFTGSFTFAKMDKLVTMFGYANKDVLGGTGNIDTGARVPAGWRPTDSFVSEPHPPYGATGGIQYRYRINNVGTSDGAVLLQRNGDNSTNMAVDGVTWLIP